jgi:hypothetical protein
MSGWWLVGSWAASLVFAAIVFREPLADLLGDAGEQLERILPGWYVRAWLWIRDGVQAVWEWLARRRYAAGGEVPGYAPPPGSHLALLSPGSALVEPDPNRAGEVLPPWEPAPHAPTIEHRGGQPWSYAPAPRRRGHQHYGWSRSLDAEGRPELERCPCGAIQYLDTWPALRGWFYATAHEERHARWAR